MAEPLKNRFGPEVAQWVADRVAAVHRSFDRSRFLDRCLDGYEDLELTDRARRIADGLAAELPADRAAALAVVTEAVTRDPGEAEESDDGMGGFRYLPFVYFVGEHGGEHFDAAMTAQYELTKRFTAEFSIRVFLADQPEATLDRLAVWASDPDADVRRLVTEGTRPRLPWAPRLRAFQEDPSPVLALLERLKDDPSEYVRRSVANNLNDISKDHPDRVVDVAARWWTDGDEDRRRLVRHGLRTLVKQGHAPALAVLGYGPDSPAEVASVSVSPERVTIGDRVAVEVVVVNPATEPCGALVDLRMHFVRADGSTSPKVFKGRELDLPAGGSGTVRKTISLAQLSTRRHHPGGHRVEVLVNGVVAGDAAFEVVEAVPA